jgi:SAM-dependent methyltransferase
MRTGDWLTRHAALLKGKRALDLGCGLGFDTRALLDMGFTVTAVDFSSRALKASRKRNPEAEHLKLDLSKGISLKERQYSVVVANLSLHYFDRAQTFRLFADIYRAMEPEGIFLFRLNSIRDKQHGAPDSLLDWEVVDVGGVHKQFFTESKIRELLAGKFRELALEEMVVHRFVQEKFLYECLAERIG